MAKLDLTSKEWCELVFEGRNKDYGAYDMRQNSPKRFNTAMLIVLAAALLVFTLPVLIRIVAPKQEKEVMTEVTTLSQLPEAEVKNNDEIKRVEALPPPPLKSSIKFTAPVIKKDTEVRDEDEIKSQEEITNAKVAISIADVKGNDELNGKDIADVKEVAKEAPVEDVPYTAVEQMPQFPGGESQLMSFISKNLKYPVIAQENGIQGRVILRFVVSKTGDIGNVQVLRGIDPSCDKEAMRVIKMMPRWIPGKQNGNSVSVFFTVPVLFKLM